MRITMDLGFVFGLVVILSTECLSRTASAWLHEASEAPSTLYRKYSRAVAPVDRTREDFMLVDRLVDGEQERRLWYSGVAAKETSIVQDDSKSLSLLQLVKGNEFLQLIFTNSDELIDCESVRRRQLAEDFLQKFFYETDTIRSRNLTSTAYKAREKPLISNHEFRRFVEANVIPDEYFDLVESKPAEGAVESRDYKYKTIEDIQDVPADMRNWLNFDELKKQCAERHSQIKLLLEKLKSDDASTRQNAIENIHRKKRALSDWLIAPNTKWCGRGHNASKYSQLGGASRADKCCRKHDHCRLHIPGLTTKWHLFNYRPFTLSYCKCDMRFRTCLKMADSPDANMVGKLFFNIVQTKCFVLKSEKVCKRRSWWGKCEERILRKRAHIRNNRQF